MGGHKQVGGIKYFMQNFYRDLTLDPLNIL